MVDKGVDSSLKYINWKVLTKTKEVIMNEQSRIRFNPVTKEIEIEGSEAFVKTYFNKLQSMMSGVTENITEDPKAARTLPAKKGKKEPKAASPRPAKKAGKVAQTEPGKKKSPISPQSSGSFRKTRKEFRPLRLKKRPG